MAIGIETPGQFAELASLLRKRKWQILLPIAFCLALAAVAVVFIPKKYEITTTVELRDRTVAQDANTRTLNTPSTSREITNAENHIKHFKRIREVIEKSGWADYELLGANDQREYIGNIRDNLNVIVRTKVKDSGSTFMDITFLCTDPKRGETFLHDLSRLWVDEVVDRERKALSMEERKLAEAVKNAFTDWTAKSGDALEIVRQGDFSPIVLDANKEGNAADPEFESLNNQRTELEKVKAQLAGAKQGKAALEKELLKTPEDVLEESKTDGFDPTAEIVKRETDILMKRAEQLKFTSRHIQYQKLQEDIESLEDQIAQYKAVQRSSEIIQLTKPNPVRKELLAQLDLINVEIEKHQGRVTTLEESIEQAENKLTAKSELREQLYRAIEERDRLQVKHSELDEAHRAKKLQLDALSDEFGQPYEFVQEAVAPDKPSEPQPALILAIGFIVGLLLGVGSSVIAEFARDGYRTAADLSRSMNLPVLGVVQRIQTRRERAARALRRTVVGLSSAALLIAIIGFTYLYTQRPEVLPVEWVEQLDHLRTRLQ